MDLANDQNLPHSNNIEMAGTKVAWIIGNAVAISKIFWDYGTLYVLRGTFLAGAADISLDELQTYSMARLLDKRVTYAVDAYPEGNMAHLPAASELYCRMFTEGLFGIVPTSGSFDCPHTYRLNGVVCH